MTHIAKNASEVMATAWANYRRQVGKHGGQSPLNRKLFASHLKAAWGDVVAVETHRRLQAEKDAQRSSDPVVADLEHRIERLEYAPFGINADSRRRELQAQIASRQAEIAAYRMAAE